MTNKFYTGIGSREVPNDIQYLMQKIATKLESLGFTLRSGGASGSDSAFESGAINPRNKEIYIPWNGFNDRYQNQTGVYCVDDTDILTLADQMIQEIHPAYGKLSIGAKKLHTRNCFQVLGAKLDMPSKFIICWAPIKGQSITGGTRTAWELGKKYGVKCFNLNDIETRNMMIDFVES